jgi:hypothetical protein
VLIGSLFLVLTSTAAAVAPNKALQSILDNLKEHSTSAQYQMFTDAINASPILAGQLNDLAATGTLAEFSIGEPSQLPPRKGPFSAWINGSVWAFTPEFMQQQAKIRLYDVVQPDDILPDNMVFSLGQLAFVASSAGGVNAAEQALKARQIQSHSTNSSLLMAKPEDLMHEWMNIHLERDSAAFIQAWNDMLDAAVQQNSGRTVTVRQAASLLMNLRYRALFINAMNSADHKLQISNSGYIASNETNRNAISAALSNMSLFDLQ